MSAGKHEHKKTEVKEPHQKEKTAPAEQPKPEIEELKDRYFRAMADLDNFRKRAAAERDEIIAFSNTALIAAILPIVDSFERAIDSFRKTGVAEETVKGVALIKKQFEDVLEKAGVTMIDAIGKPFDPNLHEAILKKPSEEHEDQTVLEVAQKGYLLKGKVIRPAMVIISERQ